MGRFRPTAMGLFGKLPARGDFVRAGLPEDFVAAWDVWCREMMAASRDILGDAWLDAWMQAPIWRFLLPAGTCGAQAALGVWLPSADKVGRQFPLAVCALAPLMDDLLDGGAWLETAEAAGLAGVVEDVPHDQLAAGLAAPVTDMVLPCGAGWWTEGSPLVSARVMNAAGLPGAESAAAMLRDSRVTGPG